MNQSGKNVGRNIKLTQEFYRRLVSLSQEIVVIHRDGKILFINPAGVKFSHAKNKEELLNKSIYTFLAPETRKLVRDRLAKALIAHRITPLIELPIVFEDKSTAFVEVRSTTFHFGNQLAFLSVMRDITKRKIAEKRKDEFIDVASHELKTPLTSISLYQEVLMRYSGDLSARVRDYIEKMGFQIERMQALMQDLLHLSRIQRRQFELHHKLFDMNKLVEDMVGSVSGLQPRRVIKVQGNIGQRINADREKIGEVIVNLLTNAIKYSPENKPIIVSLKDKKDVVSVSIMDMGKGIPKRLQKKIFEKFYKIKTTKEDSQGLGLGLFICMEIINAHSGKLDVSSNVRKGSTFTFSLPLKK